MDMNTSTETTLQHGSPVESIIRPYRVAHREATDMFQREYVACLLHHTQGNVSKAARVAKMDRSYLIKLMQRLGLRADNYLGAQ